MPDKLRGLRMVILFSVILVLVGCSRKPSGGELQKRYDDLSRAVDRAEDKQAEMRRVAVSYGQAKTDDEKKQEEVVQRLRKERDEAKAALDAAQ